MDGFDLHRTSASSARATTHQELFWYTERADSGANGWLATVYTIDGPLDRDALHRSLGTLVNAHTIFRTAYREDDGLLYQVIPDAVPQLDLEYADRSPLPEPQWDAELAAIRDALARTLDLDRGRVLRIQLTRLAPDRHALTLVFHHVATDGHALGTFIRRLFELYADATRPEDPPFQFIDFVEAHQRWIHTPSGQAAFAYWRDQLRDVVPVEVPGDLPRAAVDSRRDVAKYGITAEPMHVPMPAAVSEPACMAVSELARLEHAAPRTVYLAALIYLLQRETGQTDICIEAVANMRPAHPGFEAVQGMLLTWRIYRVNVAGCTTLREVVRRTEDVVTEADAHFTIDDYYRVVPHTVRRVVFNHAAWTADPVPTVDGLGIETKRLPLPRWKRPWDLHVNVFETPRLPITLWSGNENIFGRPRLAALQQSYLDLLIQSA